MAIGHRDGDSIVIDATRELKPPFSPEAVIDEYATLLRSYRIYKVHGDRYAGEFPRELFRKRGVQYELAEKPKSDLYRDLLPLLNSGRIVLPKSERLVNQLTGLERRTARSGKDSIDHGPGSQHDDLANSVAGCADLVGSHKPMVVSRELLARALMPSPLARGRQRLTELPPCRSSQGIQVFF